MTELTRSPVKRYIKIKLDGTPTENIMSVTGAVVMIMRGFDNPRLYTYKVTFHGNTCRIEFTRAPADLIPKLPKSYTE